jgi:hypothetical protein
MIVAPLITPEYLFKWTTIDNNVDMTLILPVIIVAQDLHIQSILGENLYFKLMSDVISGIINQPQDSNYQYLLNTYIQPALAHFAHYELMFDLRNRDTNKGVLEKTTKSDVSHPVKDGDFYAKVNHIKSRADFYNQRIREYIINNPQMFPEYYTQVGIERIVAKRTTYSSPIAFRNVSITRDRNNRWFGPNGWQINP